MCRDANCVEALKVIEVKLQFNKLQLYPVDTDSCQLMPAGNYSCVPSYATPAWVLVTVLGAEQGAEQGAWQGACQGAGRLEMEKQPASLLEQSVQDQIHERPAGAPQHKN